MAILRIALDGRAFGTLAGGVRRYTSELFGAMRTLSPSVDLVAIGGDVVPAGVSHRRAASLAPTNLGWCLAGLPIGARRVPFDVFHAPAYTGPLWGVHPLVLTVHDVSYARRPEWSPHPGGIGLVRRTFYRACAGRADRIITDSTFSKSEIIAAYGIDESRIDVIPLGVSVAFRPDASKAREQIVLHVGDLHPRRNLTMLLDAVVDLVRHEPQLSALRLVLAGKDLGVLDDLRARAAAAGATGALQYIGMPTDEDLIGWYQRAGVMAYPSRYEGFGLPVLEALACGTPVVASRAASIPEVTGDAAILLAPDDQRPWAEAIRMVLLDLPRAQEMTARGIEQARPFTWQRTATLTVQTYTQAIADRQRR